MYIQMFIYINIDIYVYIIYIYIGPCQNIFKDNENVLWNSVCMCVIIIIYEIYTLKV